MTNQRYSYDVAFSFLQQDEDLAATIAQQLSPNISYFIYSKKQEEITGTDGEVTFNRVFQSDSSVVVILYRPEWGNTKWTRIEQTAIKNRGYDQGYDFTIVVVLDPDSVVPDWLPKHQIWYNFNRFGPNGIAASIEHKLTSIGIETRPPTLAEKAATLNQLLVGQEDRKKFLSSEKAIPPSHAEAKIIYDHITESATAIGKDNSQLRGEIKMEQFGLTIRLWGFQLYVSWSIKYMNSLSDSTLHVWISERSRDIFAIEEKYTYRTQSDFDFSMSQSNDFGWRLRGQSDRFYTSKEVADYALELLFEFVANRKLKNTLP